MNIVLKDDKHREPFAFYLNDDGKLRVYANGFIDATDDNFKNYIDDKINEYATYGNSPDYYKSVDTRNVLDINKLNVDENPIYIDH